MRVRAQDLGQSWVSSVRLLAAVMGTHSHILPGLPGMGEEWEVGLKVSSCFKKSLIGAVQDHLLGHKLSLLCLVLRRGESLAQGLMSFA